MLGTEDDGLMVLADVLNIGMVFTAGAAAGTSPASGTG